MRHHGGFDRGTNNTPISKYLIWILVFVTILSAYYTAMYIVHMETDHNENHRGNQHDHSHGHADPKEDPKDSVKNHRKRYAWGSLAMKDYDVKGVIAVAQSLRYVNSTFPFVVIAAKTLSPKMIHLLQLPNLGVERIMFIDPIEIPSHIHMGWSHWQLALNKLEMWNFVDFDKIVYIDADFLILKNIDDFFDYPELTASTNLGVACALYDKPDSNQGGVNAGLVVLEPSKKKYNEMIKMFNNGTNWHNSDQGIIEAYFSDRTTLFPKEWVTFSWCCTAPWFDRSLLRAVHFTRGTINYDKLIQQNIEEDWDKNWPGKPNCDLDFYRHWKKIYFMAVSQISESPEQH